eukprot:Sspe_Gene.33348::Locus_16284_Transcript_1_1_Confidence_1.000_Length_1320::g.33348::m.33348/K09503/DNAJA2; DnaJ homolog subfamily A member 2
MPTPSDIFSAFFGGRKRGGEPKPKDIVHEFQISLEEFYNGKTKKIAATRDRLCTACDATGIKKDSGKTRDDFQCSACHGQGVQVMLQPVMMGLHQRVQVKCKSCNGRGYDIPASMQCNKCEGKQTVKERKILEVHIEKGMKRNDSITLQGEGDQIPGVRLSGDVIIVLAQKKHDFFQRRGRHLFIDQEITLAEALTGFQLPIQHLDGRQLLIKTRPGQVLDPQRLWVIDREGMPVKGTGGAEKGCLVINFTVKFPEKLTQSQISGLHEALGQPDTIEKTAEHEECTLTDYVPKKPQRGENMRGHPMMMQVDDDDEDGHPHMQQASCQHQ